MNWRLLARVAVITLIAIGIWYMLRGLQLDKLGEALESAIWWPVVLAAAINFGLLLCKALAWHVMLGPEHDVPVLRLYRYTITAFAASVIVPARAGEVIRIVLLKRRDGVPATRSTAVALAEKLIDGLSMLIIMAPLPWLLPELPASIAWWIGGLSALAIALLIGLRIAVGRVTSTGWLGRLITGMTVLRRPRRFFFTLAMLTTLWLLDVVMILLVMYAVGIDTPIAGAILVLFTLNLGVALPSTPGQVGALELGALVGLDVLHVPREQGLAFALLYHSLQVIPLVTVGLILDARLLFGKMPKAELEAAKATPPDATS
jgi:glycosyltransferase 2 family protein